MSRAKELNESISQILNEDLKKDVMDVLKSVKSDKDKFALLMAADSDLFRSGSLGNRRVLYRLREEITSKSKDKDVLNVTISGLNKGPESHHDIDDAVDKKFKNKPVVTDSESGNLFIYVNKSVEKEVMDFLTSEYPELDVKANPTHPEIIVFKDVVNIGGARKHIKARRLEDKLKEIVDLAR